MGINLRLQVEKQLIPEQHSVFYDGMLLLFVMILKEKLS